MAIVVKEVDATDGRSVDRECCEQGRTVVGVMSRYYTASRRRAGFRARSS